MAYLNEILSRLKSVNVDEAVPAIIMQTELDIVTLNQVQMRQGLNADGGEIGQLKSSSYARRKLINGGTAPEGVSDQHDTGDQYKGMTVVINDKDTFTIKSSVEYFDKNESTYGDTVFKLSKESKAEYIKGAFGKAFRAYLSDKTKLL